MRWSSLVTVMDAPTRQVLMHRLWSLAAGAVMILLVPWWLAPAEQGYYYTFQSLVALQVFFELGFNQVLVQMASHETEHARLGDGAADAREHDARLASLLQMSRRWSSGAAILFGLSVGAGGTLFFAHNGQLPASHWLTAWWLVVAGVAANVWLAPALAIREGGGDIGPVARLRLRQSIAGYVLMWIGLGLHAGLLAIALVPLTAAIATAASIHADPRLSALQRAFRKDGAASIAWQREVLPMQWRIALSWASGYLIFQALTPLLFAHQGAIEAGRVGLAMAVFNAVFAVSSSWSTAVQPRLGACIARRDRAELDRLFRAAARRSLSAAVLATLAVLIAVELIGPLLPAVRSRLASTGVLLCLAVATIANTWINAAAGYMRAHKEEPLTPQALCTGVLMLLVLELGSRQSALHAMALYALVTVGVAVPWVARLFLSYQRRTA
jgi:hypothetical protein